VNDDVKKYSDLILCGAALFFAAKTSGCLQQDLLREPESPGVPSPIPGKRMERGGLIDKLTKDMDLALCFLM
jgi:hypothetical protein